MTQAPVHPIEPIPERPALPFVGHALGLPKGPDRDPQKAHGILMTAFSLGACTGTLLRHFGCDHTDVFVQDRIARESDEVWAALEGGGRVYVCGTAGAWRPQCGRRSWRSTFGTRAQRAKRPPRGWLP
jgi:hypothetical protein